MVIQQGKLLRKAEALLIVEQKTKAAEREAKINENCPALKLSGLNVEELQVAALLTFNLFDSA